MFDRRKPPAAQPFVTHENIEAKVKWFDPEKGFGFASPSDGSGDVFLHVSSLGRSGLQPPMDGQRVRFSIRAGKKGPEAANVSYI